MCTGERQSRYGTRLLLRTDGGEIYSVPRQWTDLTAADPEVVIGGSRALFRVRDLIELARLVGRLTGREPQEGEEEEV